MQDIDFSLIRELKSRGAVVLPDKEVFGPRKGYTGHIKLRYKLFEENIVDPNKHYTVILVEE